MSIITVRKVIYVSAALFPAVIWTGLALVGTPAVLALFSSPLAGLVGLAALIGLVTVPLSFFVVISLPLRSAQARTFGTAVVASGLACLLLALIAGPPKMGPWASYSGAVLATVAMAILAELWLAPPPD